MTNTTRWHVNKYGQLIERTNIDRDGVGYITTKIYKYQDKFYVELWVNGYRIHFSEVIDC